MSIPLKPHENRVRMLIRIAMSAINLSMSAIYLKEKEGMNAILRYCIVSTSHKIYKLYKRKKGKRKKEHVVLLLHMIIIIIGCTVLRYCIYCTHLRCSK